MLGANPLVSNGSLLTAPNMRGRLRGIRERGGKVVVIDPRRTRTAEEADEHHFIRPGTDALLLAAIACTIVEEGLEDAGRAVAEHLNGLDEVRALVREFPPERWRTPAASRPSEIRRMARELAAAERARGLRADRHLHAGVRHARELARGRAERAHRATSTARAARCSRARPRASGTPRGRAAAGRGMRFGRWQSRVRGLPEYFGELPASRARGGDRHARRGPGARARHRRRATRCVSTPNSGRLERAIEGLDFMLSIDIYVNETTRHADVILPAPEPLEKSHYDLALYQLAARNVANFSPPVFEPDGAGRVGDPHAAGGDRRPARDRTATSRRSTTWSSRR